MNDDTPDNGYPYTIQLRGTDRTREVACLSEMGRGDTVVHARPDRKDKLMFKGDHAGTRMVFSIAGGGIARFDPKTLRANENGEAMDPSYDPARANRYVPSATPGGYLGKPMKV